MGVPAVIAGESESFVLAIDHNGDGSFVEGIDLHAGPKATGLHGAAQLIAHPLEKTLVGSFGYLGIGRSIERRARSFTQIAKQGELADHEDSATCFANGIVHATGIILEDSQADYLANQPLEIRFFVIAIHSKKHQQAVINRSRGFAVNIDPGS
jgi:hypothetical protein